jgi:hypothetical protein
MESEKLTIEREELYRQVWAEPIFRLAPKYGISNVALKKICKKLNVPTQPRGYWAKIQNHIRVERTPLPKIKNDQPKVHEMNMNRSPVAKSKPEKPHPTLLPETLEVIERIETWPAIKVPRNLRNAHPLVKKTLEELSEAEPDKYSMLRPWGKEILDVRVSHRLLKRALRVMQALLTRIESLGFHASAKKGYHLPTTEAVVFDETISFGISEKSRQIDHVLTDSEKKHIERYGSISFAPKWDYEPTGVLSLKIDSWAARGIRKEWNDSKSKGVENHLKDFLINLVTIADLEKKRRLEIEERKKRWQEELEARQEMERQRQEEQKRLQDLENQALRWAKATQLRAYIVEVEGKANGNDLPAEEQERLASWLRWAREHADRIDPLIGEVLKEPSAPKVG